MIGKMMVKKKKFKMRRTVNEHGSFCYGDLCVEAMFCEK